MNFHLFFLAILGLYLIATAFYLVRLVVQKPILSVVGLRVTLLAALAQVVGLVWHFFSTPNQAFTSYFDYYQVSAVVLALIFIGLCFTRRFYASGPLFVTLIAVLCILSLTHENPYSFTTSLPGYGYLFFHLSAIFLSLALFSVAFVSALLFLISERQIKTKRFEGFMSKLPSLTVLEDVHNRAVFVAFLVFTFAILTGAGYSKINAGHYITGDLKQILSGVIWLFFALLLNFRHRQGWQGHRGIVLSMFGFSGMAVLFWVGLLS